MTNNDPEYVAQLERALEAAELEIKGLEEQIRKQDETIADIADQLAPFRMGEPIIYSAAQLATAHAEGRAKGFQEAVKALSDNMNDIIAAAIERLLEKKP